jgi:hypothetical protein
MAGLMSENWIKAGIEKQIDGHQQTADYYKNLGDKKMQYYYMGIIRGLKDALADIESTFAKHG